MVVRGLEDYRLTLAGLAKLGKRPVKVSIQLRGRSLAGLIRFPPRTRDALLRVALKRQFASLARHVPEAALRSRDTRKGSWTLDGTLAANRVQSLASRKEVAGVSVEDVPGRAKRRPRPKEAWFCVWGVVAIQVERQRAGRIDLEDRLVLVRAYDDGDAVKRLQSEWTQYAEPYMNPEGYLVRWQLISIKDTYELFDAKPSPQGTEVFSRLRSAAMRPEFRWVPSAPNKALRPKSRARKPAKSKQSSRAARG